jgi:hypothetical protein
MTAAFLLQQFFAADGTRLEQIPGLYLPRSITSN